MREIDVAATSAVPEGEARGFVVEGEEIVLCNVDGDFYALQGMCTTRICRWTAEMWRTACSPVNGTARSSTCAAAQPERFRPLEACALMRLGYATGASTS